MDEASDGHGSSLGSHAEQPVVGEHLAPTAADAAHVFKRPTPSISVLLSSIPPVHGKLPPLRSSADGAAVLHPLGSNQHQLGHLQHLQHPAELTLQQQQQAGAGLVEQRQQHAAPTGHIGQQQLQLQQQGQQQSQAHTAQQQLRVSAELPHYAHNSQASAPPLPLPQQHEQSALPQQQPNSAIPHPREFFLRFSQLRSSTAAVDADSAHRQSLTFQTRGSLDEPQFGQQQQQQQHQKQQQQQQQQQQHWWQKRPSVLMPRSSAAQVPSPAAEPQSGGTATTTSSSSKGSWAARRVWVLQLLDSPAVSWVLIIMSLFVIFQEDFKYAVLPPPADLWFEGITLALLITFLLEISLSCLVRPGFFLSFYFWLDTVAVLSLAFELPALRAVLLLGETQEYVNLNNSDSYLMAAGAQALVSSKAGRAAKVVRLFRQLQLIKLFKQLELRQRLKRVLAEGSGTPAGLTAAEAQVLSKYKHSESRVGQRLSDLTMKRVITGILAMLIVLPALEITSGINGATASPPLGGLEMLHMQALTGGTNASAFDSSLKAFQRNVEYQLAGQTTGGILRLVLANTTYVSHPTFASVGADKAPGSSNSSSDKQTSKQYRRYLEMQAAYAHSWLCPSSSPVAAAVGSAAPQAEISSGQWPQPEPYFVLDASAAANAAAAAAGGDVGIALMGSGCVHMQSFVLLDIKWSLQAQSVYGIARTLFLVCLLGLGSYLIHSDTYRLVLQPVQRMVERVREMAEDPLMLAAVRSSPPASGLSGTGDTLKGSDNSCSTPKGAPHPVQPPALPASPVKGSAAAPAAAQPSSSSDGSKQPKIRFWTSVRVHAVADGMDPSSPTAAAGMKPRLSVQQQQLFSEQQQQGGGLPATGSAAVGVRPRPSGTQLMVAQARRMSTRLSAQISAAGHAAAAVSDRWRVQLVQRASAIKQMVMVDETEQSETGQGQYETRLLEQSIYKICALLAVGFGDAGAEVIAENIKKDGDLNPCMPGKKTVAVFGFCDIRRFTDTTEVLQEGVMEFVNVIAHLVHSAVAARGGAANKNIGDAFLLVWKLPKGLDDRDVSLLSSGGLAASNTPSQVGPSSPAGAMRTATLNWPGLLEEGDEGQQPHSNGDSSPRNLSLMQAGAQASPRSISPGPLPLLCSSTSQAAADREISHMLQQQQHQMTMKRAASGIMEGVLTGGGGKRHSGGTSGSPHHSGAGGIIAGGDASQSVEASGLSRSGLRRAMLSIKSVAATPLSAAAKASIINTIADSALASFVVIQVAICVSRVLKAYSNRADLTARMPGFRVQMGFGLHVGWAIEGAIGSEYKIDASYLSPNVNLASRLEAATKQYSVPMLLSRDFVDCLSPGVRAKVRQVDCVTVKGSCQPLGLFCYDLDLTAAERELAALNEHGMPCTTSCPGGTCVSSSHTSSARSLLSPAAALDTVSVLQQDSGGSSTNSSMNAVGRVRHSLAVMPDAASAARSSVVVSAGHTSKGHEEQGQGGPDPAELLLSLEFDDDWVDNPVVAHSWAISWDFKEAFDKAFEDYIAGHWPRARDAFQELLMSRRAPDGSHLEDPPTKTLLTYMASHDYVAPESWAGVRELTEK